MNTISRSFRGVLLAALFALPLACSNDGSLPSDPGPDPTPDPTPQTGFIQVTSSTSGSDLDPDGYTVSMDGNGDRSIGLNGVTTFSDVPEGQHQVAIAGVADNCAVSGANPASAAVTGGETAAVSFAVTCDALPIGSLEVTTTVTNNFDPDGYDVFVAAVNRGEVDVEGGATFDDLPAGSQEVELRDIAPNCAVDGANPATVDIPVGGTGTHSFPVTCTSPPDGRIIYRSWDSITGTSGFSVVNADGSGPFVLRHWGPEFFPFRVAWSADGNRVAFINDEHEPGNHDLYVMNKDGTNVTRLTTSPDREDYPAWSPDGSRIAFQQRSRGFRTDSEVFLINADGSGLVQLTDDPALASYAPSWSPDGTRIALSQNDDPGSMNADHRISVMNADGSSTSRINEPAPICDQGFNAGFPAWQDFMPRWSPGGSRIAFTRRHVCEPEDVTNAYDIMVVNPEGTDLINLTDSPTWEADPSWSPDGSRIVFEGGSADIYVMNANATDVMQLPVTGDRPDWGP